MRNVRTSAGQNGAPNLAHGDGVRAQCSSICQVRRRVRGTRSCCSERSSLRRFGCHHSGNQLDAVFAPGNYRVVRRQSGKYRVQFTKEYEFPDGTRDTWQNTKMFDGEITRFVQNDEIANIVAGYSSEKHFVRPHMVLMKRAYYYMPLSVLLSGTEQLAMSPTAGWTSDVAYEDLGTRELDGLLCHQVNVLRRRNSKQTMRIELLLAVERNYLPAQVTWYHDSISKTKPVEVGRVVEWSEVEPGIWFPMQAELVAYNPVQMHLRPEAEPMIQSIHEIQAENISLTPDFDDSYFSSITIPDGTAVYEVKDQRITRSYRQGDPRQTSTSDWSLLVIANIVAIIALVMWQWWRVRNRSVTSTERQP